MEEKIVGRNGGNGWEGVGEKVIENEKGLRDSGEQKLEKEG